MAAVHQGTTGFNAGLQNLVQPAVPATATTGRLIVLVARQHATTGTLTGPSDFTQYLNLTIGGQKWYVGWKIAASGDVGTNKIVSSTVGGTWSGAYSVYTGFNTTTPLIGSSSNSGTMAVTALTVTGIVTT